MYSVAHVYVTRYTCRHFPEKFTHIGKYLVAALRSRPCLQQIRLPEGAFE